MVSCSFLSDDLAVDASQLVGVCRLWVHEAYQRKGVASKLVDTLRMNFSRPAVVKATQIAFSDPTDMGAGFAAKYLDNEAFLVYSPRLNQ